MCTYAYLDTYWLEDPQCKGTESNFNECLLRNGWGDGGRCSKYNHLYVTCGEFELTNLAMIKL